MTLLDIPMPPPMGPDPERDGYGRYLLTDPISGRKRAYTRVSTLKSKSSDTFGLDKWKMRTAIMGVAYDQSSRGLLLSRLLELADREGEMPDRSWKEAVNKIADDAFDTGGGNDASARGTALHAWTEWLDLGLGALAHVPEMFRPYCEVYLSTLAENRIEVVPELIEKIVVNLAYDVAGQFDRVYRLLDGSLVLGDLKSGANITIGWREIAQQMAGYQTAEYMLDEDTGEWVPTPDMRTDYAIIVHVPVMEPQPRAEIVTIPLAKGRTFLNTSLEVMHIQRDRDMGHFTLPTPEGILSDLINQATTEQQLADLYEQFSEVWTDAHTMLGKRRLSSVK